jgi:hypothetical protein
VAGFRRLVLLGITDRDGARQAAAARETLEADPRWSAQPTGWRDARRGFEATVFLPGGAPASGMAHHAEGVVIGGADNGGEQP